MATAGSSIDFDGTSGSSYVTMGSFSGLNGATQFSMGGWYNFNSLNASDGCMSQYLDFQLATFYNTTSATEFYWTIKKYNDAGNWYSPKILLTDLTVGSWQFVYFTWAGAHNDASFKIYIDGSVQGFSSTSSLGDISGSIGNDVQDYQIGCLNTTSHNCDAKLSHMSIYDIGLTNDEVKEIMYNPYSLPRNNVSLVPLHKATPVDVATGDSADAVGGDADLDTSGPPIYSTGYYC